MKILLVHCHPVAESYVTAIAKRLAQHLRSEGHDVDHLDLYGEGFDPVMSADERRAYNDLTAGEHPLPDHARRLGDAEAILFVYPTWWYGLPAMLKGWLDRVWAPGTAFEISPDNGPIRPLLTQITHCAVVTTCGAPRWWSWMVGHPGRKTLLRGIRALFHKRCRTLFLAHYLMDISTPESRAAFLEKVERRVTAFIPKPPRAAPAE
ncbi:MAG: NAD(P)H dehydrogenase [Hyphomicrobiales bacterium]|nr:MAG: NAD(P)H dehydrogenase [Hyphomicrobiales bacterium]